MSQTPEDDRLEHDHVETRAELLPEERVAGSEDAEAQAAAILADSEERTEESTP